MSIAEIQRKADAEFGKKRKLPDSKFQWSEWKPVFEISRTPPKGFPCGMKTYERMLKQAKPKRK